MFDRLAKGDDKICALAEFAGYALYKEKGAPIALVIPEDGMPASPVVAGAVDRNSLMLGLATATIGVLLAFLLAWTIQRSKLPFRGLLEYVVMFPQSVPRLVFAYLTVFMPLGVRTITGVMVQLDKSLDECGRVCGASWAMRMRTITMPLLKPGLYATWMLLFVASVRELGASILLMGPHSKVITPSIVESWFATSSELTAAMALIQTAVIGVAIAIFTIATRCASQHKV